MITRLFQGMAKSLFLLASALAGLALLAGYCSYRLLRAAFAKQHGMPIRDAAFMAMSALLVLANAIREQAIKRIEAEQASLNGNNADAVFDTTAPPEPEPVAAETEGDTDGG